MNNYQEGHCHYFAAQLYIKLRHNNIKCKYCVIYGYHVDKDDNHFAETLDHCYVKVGKYYYDSNGQSTLWDIKDRERSRMNTEETEDTFYYTERVHTNKILEDYFIQPPQLPLNYEQLYEDVNQFIIQYNLVN